MGKKPENFYKSIVHLSKIFKDTQYAFRGTASLVLQNFDMNVDDIDILCDKKTALKANELLSRYIIEKIDYKESDKFKSYYGKFLVDDVQIEIMGEWSIKDTKGNWSEPFDAKQRVKLDVEGDEVYVTTIDTELDTFLKMGRWNTYHKIMNQLPKDRDDTQLKLV